jgi:hypothetical protein
MRLRTVLGLLVVALIAATFAGVSTAVGRSLAQSGAEGKTPVGDPISGEWEGRFEIGGGSATATFNLKLDGDKVTGTVESAHTGPGTLSQGLLVDKKLSFTLNFAAHESIAVTGSFQDGNLSGEFRTEGMVGKWIAHKKGAPLAGNGAGPGIATPAATAPMSPEFVSGEWDATFEAEGTAVPVALKLTVAGDKVTGTSESAHLGPGKISKGSLADNKLTFTMEGTFGSAVISSVAQDGKLVGEFDFGSMHGKFVARKK